MLFYRSTSWVSRGPPNRQLTDAILFSDLNHSLLSRHTYTCALTTRGGICDCKPFSPTVSMVSAVASVESDNAGPDSGSRVRGEKGLQEPGLETTIATTHM